MKNLWATYFHRLSTDSDPQHGLCNNGLDSWCKYKCLLTNEEYTHKHPLLPTVMTAIKPIFRDLLSYWTSVHMGRPKTYQIINNVIWSHVLKTMFLGIDTIKVRVWDAVITFNSGYLVRVKVFQNV